MSFSSQGPLGLVSTPAGDTDDPFVEFGAHMALVHNIIIRGWNSIYLQAPKLREIDVCDFLHYCRAWHEFTIGHHDSEERVLFPEIVKATGVDGVMDEDVKEHAALHHGLESFRTYINTSLASELTFSATELLKIMDAFSLTFQTHFQNEPVKLVSLSRYSFDMKTIGDNTTQYALQRYSTTDVLPILWYNLDTQFEGGKWANFPPLPAPVKWFMVNVLPI